MTPANAISGTMGSKETDTPFLVDFDWKLKYAVASDSLASVNKPLLRLELSLSAEKGDSLQKPQILVGEYTKSQLDTLISQMEAIRQRVDRVVEDGPVGPPRRISQLPVNASVSSQSSSRP